MCCNSPSGSKHKMNSYVERRKVASLLESTPHTARAKPNIWHEQTANTQLALALLDGRARRHLQAPLPKPPQCFLHGK